MKTHIKLHNQNGELVGVEELDPANWVRQLRNGTIELCDRESEAQGVQDASGSVIYQLSGRTALVDGSIIRTATVITEAEYDELANDYPEPDPQPPDPEDDIAPLTVAEMRMKLAEQDEQIAMLTECLLEMSGLVYG